ncbi:hypothetical protein HZF24_08995 [Sedimentibacter hydroxybenzoicus DSM 7310]|uniref:Bacterial transcriptional activator domain-containing protein n=1 Tax=Sedimentibacter hydroxybenzoicus DSM 7310 TaxID=1123245 RepID=A0A974BJ94_SEDHY|nr:bacterial transcriptional activator domain-containing protein [Sedimentibacter hydroxybenzoicus]NYB74280.1 hypothetical protein [Sedimentibacter hydroxybenzoicus DSM 7310]
MKLYINTLGEFDIKSNGNSILMQSKRTYKLYKLFEYFLTFRNKKLLPENIIDNLLSESDSDDPKNILRTQIFRLRKVIKSFVQHDEDKSKYINLNFKNGYYCLDLGENIVIDIDEFEELIRKGDTERENNTQNSIQYYENAIELYKGAYLSDNAYEVWLVPTRNYYQRLYQKTLLKLIELLKVNNNYEKVISLCEKSLLIEPYDELIHENLMEAMINLGQSKAALNHYEYAYKLLERELDTKPSEQFTGFLDKIQNLNFKNNDIDISGIKNNLDEEFIYGALHCDLAYFKVLYNLEKRKSIRKNEDNYLCIINYSSCEKSCTAWSSLLEKTLRKGDVFSFWNENQILILLYNVKEDGINIIIDRIFNKIKKCKEIKKDEVKIVFQPLFREDVITNY